MDLPDDGAIVAGLIADEAGAGSLIAALQTAGIEGAAIRVGASDSARAQAIATAHGVRHDLIVDDPLAGAPGLSNAADQRKRVDRGGVLGACIGGLAGGSLGLFPAGRFMALEPGQASLADGLLFFVAGAVAGAMLGGAFGPQLSTHAGFRLIDGMDEGRIGAVVSCARAQTSAVRAAFESVGATDVVAIG